MKTIEQLRIRLAKLKTLENYYNSMLTSDYTRKQLKKIYKEQISIRTKMQQAEVTSIY